MKSDVAAAIREAIASYRNEMVEFTSQLVAIPTENPPGHAYRQCATLIERRLTGIGLDCQVIEVTGSAQPMAEQDFTEGPAPGYCLLSSYGAGRKTLYFHGHYDVVPAADTSQFQPYVDAGNIYGRGTADMKGGLAAMVFAIKAIKDCGIKLAGRIGLTIVPDEETAGARGSRHLAQVGLLGKNAIGMLTAEPTGGAIWNANRGAVSLKVNVKGKSAHVALWHEGVNAFERMVTVANALLELKAEVESRLTGYDVQPEAARRSILLLGGQVGGGTNFNVVPGDCFFTIDRRINPEEDLGQEKSRLLAVLDGLRTDGIELEVEVLQEGSSSGTPSDNPIGRTLAEAVEEIVGRRPAFEMCPGLLEIRFYAERGVPAFAYGPGLLSVSHGPDESVSVERVLDCAAVYALTAARLLAP